MNGLNGTVTGGWSFVIAAYGLTAVILTVYGVSIVMRLRTARRGGNR
jgi:hypothetical protein